MRGRSGEIETALRFAENGSLQPADRFIIPKTAERRTYDRFIRIQSESPRSYGYLSSRRPAESPGMGARRQRKKKALRMCGAGRRHF